MIKGSTLASGTNAAKYDPGAFEIPIAATPGSLSL